MAPPSRPPFQPFLPPNFDTFCKARELSSCLCKPKPISYVAISTSASNVTSIALNTKLSAVAFCDSNGFIQLVLLSDIDKLVSLSYPVAHKVPPFSSCCCPWRLPIAQEVKTGGSAVICCCLPLIAVWYKNSPPRQVEKTWKERDGTMILINLLPEFRSLNSDTHITKSLKPWESFLMRITIQQFSWISRMVASTLLQNSTSQWYWESTGINCSHCHIPCKNLDTPNDSALEALGEIPSAFDISKVLLGIPGFEAAVSKMDSYARSSLLSDIQGEYKRLEFSNGVGTSIGFLELGFVKHPTLIQQDADASVNPLLPSQLLTSIPVANGQSLTCVLCPGRLLIELNRFGSTRGGAMRIDDPNPYPSDNHDYGTVPKLYRLQR
ncbi:hypothetical protein Ancab_010517 [Ancistrocladus abbreviatus]